MRYGHFNYTFSLIPEMRTGIYCQNQGYGGDVALSAVL